MDHQRPDQSEGARIEDDFIRPVTPMKNASRRRLPAALPIAIAGLLVVTSVAFGATVINTIVGAAPNATAVVLDDDPADGPGTLPTEAPVEEPTEAPVEAPTAAPTAEPTLAVMTLEASLSGAKVALAWTYFNGDDFAYYKVVRSTDATAEWPLGANDKLVAAISDQNKLTFTDAAPAGATLTYRVFAVKSSTEGYAVIGSTNVVTVTTPKPTPKPTPSCGMSLSAKVVSAEALPNTYVSGTSVKLTWTKYRCSHFQYYVVGRSPNSNINFPLPQGDTSAMAEIGNVGQLTWTDTDVASGQTYYYRVMAWNSEVFCNGGTVLAKTNYVKVTIP
jgi:hypothetical protein